MTSRTLLLATLGLAFALAPTQVEAAGSCSGFAVIKSYDEAAGTAKIKYVKGRESAFFPKTDGAPNNSKIPKKCRGRVKKKTELKITPTGGRMTVTQVRANFTGKMLNNTEDPTWVPAQVNKLVADKTKVVVLVRQGLGKDAPYGITTIYLPITQEERDEIKRLNAQAEDVD